MDILSIFTNAIIELIFNQPLIIGIVIIYTLFSVLSFLLRLVKKRSLRANFVFEFNQTKHNSYLKNSN